MDAQTAPGTNRSQSAYSFLGLVVKKKEQRSRSLAFSRLLLAKQDSKFMVNRINYLASVIKHSKYRRLTLALSSIMSAGLKRKPLREPGTPDKGSSSQTRLPRTSRNRLTVAEGRDKSVGSGEDSQAALARDAENKMMALTQEARDAMNQMQRFDRYIYPFESEKILKVPIESEMRRLEKIKSANKPMWNTLYDNELTITCLYNHMKNLYELNRDLSQIDLLKVQNEQLQKRIIETNVQKQKELKEARAGNRDAGGSNTTLLNQYKTNIEFLVTTLHETNERAKKLLQNQIKKANPPHKELFEVILDMVNELILSQQGPNEMIGVQTALSKLIQQQADSTRTIQNLDRQRKNFEKLVLDAKSQQSRQMNQSLLNVCVYIISLHSKLKVLKGEGSSRDMANGGNTERLKSDLDNQRARIRDLEAKIQQLNRQKRALEDMKDISVITTWQTELTTIIQKIQKKEAYQADITKQRKLLTARKDNKFNGIIGVNLNLLDVLTKKERELDRLEKALQDKKPEVSPIKLMEEKLVKERQQREDVEADLARVMKELEEYKQRERSRDKDSQPLQSQLAELFKVCVLFEQVIAKRDEESGTGTNTTSIELQRNRKTLQTKKKFSPTLLPIINIIESLTRLILDAQSNDKKRVQEQEKFQLQRTKELTGLDAMTKAFMKLIESESVRIDEGLINRLRKNLETANTKIERGLDSPVSDLYDLYRNVVEVEARLVSMLENLVKEASINSQKQLPSPRMKEQEESLNRRIQQLEKQLQLQKGRFNTRQQQFTRLQGQEQSLNRRIQQLERMLEVEKGRYATRDLEWANRDQQLKSLRADNKSKDDQIRSLRGQVNAREAELRTLKAESAKRSPEVERELKSQKESVQRYIEAERTLNIRIGDLERSEGEFKRQAIDLSREINDLKRTIGDLERQLKQSGDSKERVRELTGQLSEANRQIRELNGQVNESNRTISDMKRKQQQLNRTNAQQQQQLPQVQRLYDQIAQLKITIDQYNNQINDMVSKQTRLNSQIRQLSDRQAKLNQQIRDLTKDMDNLNKAARQKADDLERERRDSSNVKGDIQRYRDQAQRHKDEAQKYKDELQRTKDEAQRAKSESQIYKDDAQRSRDETLRHQSQLQRLKDDMSRSKITHGNYSSQLSELKSTIVILENKILVLTEISNTVKFLQQANRSLKDQNDVLRLELTQRNRNISTQASDSSRLQSLNNQLSQLKLDHSKLKSEHDRVLSLLGAKNKDADTIVSLTKEVAKLNNAINSNESVFNQLVHDNERFIREINELRANADKWQQTIRTLEDQKIRISTQSNLSSNFQIKEAQLNEQIRILKQDKSNSERELQSSKQLIQSTINSLTEKETKLRGEKMELERELMSKNNELSDLKIKLSRMSSESSQSSSNQLEINRLTKLVRELEMKQSDNKRLIESNSRIYEQNQRRLNNEVSNLKIQLSSSSTYQTELDRIRSTHVERSVLDSKDRQLSSANSQLSQLRRQLQSLKRSQPTTNPATQRQLQDSRQAISKLQTERNNFQAMFQQKKREYDMILLELQSRDSSQAQYKDRVDMLEKSNSLLQRQLIEQESIWKSKLAEGSGIGRDMGSPSSKYVIVLEEKRMLEMEYNKLKSVLEKEYSFKKDIEEKFAAMLQDKTKYLEKIDSLQKTVHTKELQLLKNYELREDSIRQLINENRKMQKQLHLINEKLSAEHRVSTKSLEQNLAKLESELSKLRRQNTNLRDEIEDLEDELIERSRNKTPKRSSRVQKFTEELNDDKYMLKVEGDKLKDEIKYLESSNERLKQKIRMIEDASVHSVHSGGESRRRISANVNMTGDERLSHLNQRLSEKVKYLERERHTLYQRLKILSIFSRIENPSHAFIHNLNRVLDNILAFLNESEQFSDNIITYGNFISQITESVSSENYERYFQNVEDFIKDLFMRTFQTKNEILAKQAGQLIQFKQQMSELVNEQIDYIEEEQRETPRSSYSRHDFERTSSDTAGMASFIALQHLFRLYVRAKSPEVLEEIAQLLNVSEYPGEGLS